MTSTISPSSLGSFVGARSGEREGKSNNSDGRRFADTLAGLADGPAGGSSLARTQGRQARWTSIADGLAGGVPGFGSADKGLALGIWQQLGANEPSGLPETIKGSEEEEDDAGLLGDGLLGQSPATSPMPLNDARSAMIEMGGGASEQQSDPHASELVDAGKVDADEADDKPVASADSRVVVTAATASVIGPAQTTQPATIAAAAAQTNARQQPNRAVPSMEGIEEGRPLARDGAVAGQPTAPAIPVASTRAENTIHVKEDRGGPPAGTSTPDDQKAPQTATDRRQDTARRAVPNSMLSASGGAGEQQPDATSGRVAVISTNSAPAPAPTGAQVLGSTAAGLVSELGAEPTWRAATQEAASAQVPRPGMPAGAQTLRIQLHPIELGMVTARLTQSGSHMSVEIQVESNDARHRLSTESDQIIKALKAVGIEVDKLTIQQAPQTVTQSGASQHGGAREMSQQQQQQQASGENESRGQGDRGTPRGQTDGSRNAATESTADRSGHSLYI